MFKDIKIICNKQGCDKTKELTEYESLFKKWYCEEHSPHVVDEDTGTPR